MRIVIFTDWYSEKMGYAEYCLAKSLATLGNEVHIVTSTAQVYFNEPFYKEVYEPFIGEKIVPAGSKKIENFTLHRLPIQLWWKRIHLFRGLYSKLKEIRPDVVHSFEVISFSALQISIYKAILKYRFFTAIHTVGSVYPAFRNYNRMSLIEKMRIRIFDTLPGLLISFATEMSYGATIDASEIGERFFGIPNKKIKTTPLGVDTDLFHPEEKTKVNTKRGEIRNKFGFKDDDIVCIFTGRFTFDKNPLCLAQAISNLNEAGYSFKGIFFGNGPQEKEIRKCTGCVINEFVPYHELPDYYRASEIGVWPRQESTSMIDAAACGLPIVVSDKLLAKERIDGNGITYYENDVDNMQEALKSLMSEEVRDKLGRKGAEKMQREFSWLSIAKRRITDYEYFLNKNSNNTKT